MSKACLHINVPTGYEVADIEVRQMEHDGCTMANLRLIRRRDNAIVLDADVSIRNFMRLSRDVCSALTS